MEACGTQSGASIERNRIQPRVARVRRSQIQMIDGRVGHWIFLCLRVPNLRSSWALPAASREHVSRSPRSVPKELSEPLMQRQLFLEWLADFHKNQYVPKPQTKKMDQMFQHGNQRGFPRKSTPVSLLAFFEVR